MSLMELSGYARAMLLIPARGDQKCCPVLFSKWVGRRLEAESPEKLWCRLWSNGSQASARNVWYERWLWPLPHTDECHPKPLPFTRNPSRLQNSSAETVLFQKYGVPLEFASGSCSALNHVGSRYSVSQPCRLKPVWLKPLASGCLPGLTSCMAKPPADTHSHSFPSQMHRARLPVAACRYAPHFGSLPGLNSFRHVCTDCRKREMMKNRVSWWPKFSQTELLMNFQFFRWIS